MTPIRLPALRGALRARSVRHGEDYRLFEAMLVGAGAPRPRREYRFHPTRRWLLDFAWPRAGSDGGVYVEIDGGAFTGGAHARGTGLRRDREKDRALTLCGWRGLRYLPDELTRIAVPETIMLLRVQGIA